MIIRTKIILKFIHLTFSLLVEIFILLFFSILEHPKFNICLGESFFLQLNSIGKRKNIINKKSLGLSLKEQILDQAGPLELGKSTSDVAQ